MFINKSSLQIFFLNVVSLVYFVQRERRHGAGWVGGGEDPDLGGDERRETVVKIYYIKKTFS